VISSYLAFLGISLVVIVTPGPDTALTIRNTLLGGRTGGAATAAGVACGQAVWAIAASLGVIALLTASAPLFLALKLAGAAYLVYLGAQALQSALRPARGAWPPQAPSGARHRLAPSSAFRQGMISNLGNPKMAVFFASLLPQFAPPTGSTFATLMALGLTFVLMTLAWLTFYAAIISKAGDLLRRPAINRMIEAITGTVLIGLGLRIAAGER
jgi:threonine/homoserine/homoserine lactone efflux protein